jgi:SpoVK/Ycf46/Vps4 family AAA+-type ATPase
LSKPAVPPLPKDPQKELRELKKELEDKAKRIKELEHRDDQWRKHAQSLQQKLSKHELPEQQLADMFNVNDENFYFSDIGGLDTVLEKVREVQHGLLHPEDYVAMGIQPPKGILLHGPPGCGKTMIFKAMANEMDIDFIDLNTTKFASHYVNKSANNLGQILTSCNARYKESGKKILICLDDAEALLRPRGTRDSTGETDKAQTVFLNYMDGLEDNEGLLFAAATNKYDLIDEAVKRPKRFSDCIEVPRPGRDGVEEIFRKKMMYFERMAGRQVYEACDCSYLADVLAPKQPSGADVEQVLSLTSRRLIRDFRSQLEVSVDDDTAEWVIDPKFIVVTQKDLLRTMEQYDPAARRNHSSRPIGFGAAQ